MNPNKLTKTMRNTPGAVIIMSTLAACLLISPLMAVAVDEDLSAETQLTLDDLRTFTDVFNLVRKNYVDEVSDHELLSTALKSMVASLDPYSAFLAPEDFQDQNNTSRGRHAGIGVELDIRQGRLFIDRVSPGGPADLADLQIGDMLTSVDGNSIRGRSIEKSIKALSGAPGTDVDIEVRRGNEPTTEVNLVREFTPVPSVEGQLLDSNYAYLALSHFHDRSAQEMKSELEILQESAGPAGINGILIDLRNNRGGVIGAASEIADGFLDQGLVVYTRGRHAGSQLDYHAQPGQWVPGVPVAVLINRKSASASEILAGALQDHQRAVIVGETSFGKGTVQSVLTLKNGSALKLTTARYYTPSGRSFEKSGIKPDINARRGKAAKDEDATVPEVDLGNSLGATTSNDRALQLALEALKNGWEPIKKDG